MTRAPEAAGLNWFKSSRSAGNGSCVEIAELPQAVAMRDSKDPQGPVLRFGTENWRQFIDDVRQGTFDLPGLSG